MSDTSGTYRGKNVSIDFGGACPVQGYGMVDGYPIYYRSRGEGWQFHVYDSGSPDVEQHGIPNTEIFVYTEKPYTWPHGGWITTEESRKNIRKAIGKFRYAQNHKEKGKTKESL